MNETLGKLQVAQAELEPRFKALRLAMSSLKAAQRLAADDKADALPMQRALLKLETAAEGVESTALVEAVDSFAAATKESLDNLAFEFAGDLRDEFAARGVSVSGHPPTLAVGLLVLRINMASRKGQWFYGREPLTRPIPLSLKGILKAYERQAKRIGERETNLEKLLQEIYSAWKKCGDKRQSRPAGGRINIVETFSQLKISRQSKRFWNNPSRSTFKDYERPLFVRDLVLLREQSAGALTADGKQRQLRLGVATKSQADQANRSIWLPSSALEGEYYSDIIFD